MRRGLIANIALLLVLLFAATPAHAQKKKKKDAEVDTVKVAFLNGFTIHADLIGAYQMLFSDCGQWEVGARINLKDRYFPAVEVGWGQSDQHDDYTPELTCKAKAPYFRVGCDFNILKNKHDIYKAFGGIRYGFTSFNYDMCTANPVNTTSGTVAADGTTTTTETTTSTIYTQNNGLHCTFHWLEAVFGVDAKIWGPIHLGWDVRYRRRLINKHDDIGESWYVPGYGGKKAAGFGANFNLIIGL